MASGYSEYFTVHCCRVGTFQITDKREELMSDFAPYSGADIDNQLKILLVGDAGVGKSRSYLARCA